ncbi:hypothetical protein [Cellulophaga sp. BC115SP]|nr:hypothetical protein [Cellulophaga sp. BC115SP]
MMTEITANNSTRQQLCGQSNISFQIKFCGKNPALRVVANR